MGKKAFDKVKAGLEAAIAYQNGDKSRGRIVKVKVANIRLIDVKTLRLSLDLTQGAFALRYGIPLATLRRWEQGGAPKTGANAAYLTAIAKNPERIAKDLAA